MAKEIREIDDPSGNDIREMPDPEQNEQIMTFLGSMPKHPGFPLENVPNYKEQLQNQIKKTGLLTGSLGAGGLPGIAGRAVESIPYIGGALSRIIPQAGIGAAQDENNRGLGALIGGLSQGAAEVLPFAGKAITKVAEYVNPKEFTKTLSNSIKNAYDASMKAASNEFEPVLEAVGEKNIRKGKTEDEFLNVDDEIRKYFSPDIKRLSEKYLSKPTFENAHDLQSQIGTRIGKLRRGDQDASTMNAIEGLKIARDALRRDQINYLNTVNPELANKYLKGTQITRDIIGPFRREGEIFKISEGAKSSSDPKDLLNALKKVREKHFLEKKEPLSDSHFLSEALTKLEPKINKGKAAETAIGLGTGALAGLGAGGLGGAGLEGAAIGATAGKFLTPGILEASTNPEVQRLAHFIMKNIVRPGGRTAQNFLLQGQQ